MDLQTVIKQDKHTDIYTKLQAYGLTDIQTERQTDDSKQSRQTDNLTVIRTDNRQDRKKNSYTKEQTYRQTERVIYRPTDNWAEEKTNGGTDR